MLTQDDAYRIQAHAVALRAKYPKHRLGQVAFFALDDMNEQLAKMIGGTKLDPFYDDSRLEAFWNFLFETLAEDEVGKNGSVQDSNSNR